MNVNSSSSVVSSASGSDWMPSVARRKNSVQAVSSS